jgi:NAD-dependent SIR2 family protein deacetylase
MGVDSGLPDFREPEGFWKAYPSYARLGLDFVAMANPRWFRSDPAFAWGFYGHRMNLYRATTPHDGFATLRRWAEGMPHGAFVVTSNVDGHFQCAGFDPERVAEVHGSVHWMQCTSSCGVGIFPSEPHEVRVDESTFRAEEPLPACPRCGALARPNILMFGDAEWDGERSQVQNERLAHWLGQVVDDGADLVIVECGAGRAVPTIRRLCEGVARQAVGTLVRINVREPEVPAGHLGLPAGARDALRAIEERLGHRAGG